MRNLLLIDGGYMAAMSRNVNNGLDIKKIKEILERKFGKIDRAHFFTCLNEDAQAGFHKWLKLECRMDVIVKGVKSRWCNACGTEKIIEKGVDVAMATDAIKFAHKGLYDRLILINGDGDLIDAIRYVRDDLGKDVVICGSQEMTSGDLMLNSDEFVDLFEENNFKAILKGA